ncbi:MAG: mannonate dehydratase [Bryobacteraceae bacterium]
MQRRNFLQLGAAAAALPATANLAHGKPARRKSTGPLLFKAGTQHGNSEQILTACAAFGINHICSSLPSRKMDEKWSVDGLSQLRERVEKHGIKLECVPLPMSSAYITRAEFPEIMLGKSPERDREIDEICQMIRNCSKAGIPMVKYNLSILGVVRTGRTPGRGGASYSTWNYAEAKQEPPLTEAGPVSADLFWERIEYFVKRAAPVADEFKVKMACHPHDPAMPADTGFRGVHRVLGSPDGLKKLLSLHESPYFGLNFCQGTVSEMLKDPGKEIYDVIRYFGSRKKIFNVHFRNIKGGFGDFQETFPDNGSVNMLEAAKVYKEVGYDGMIMPDHVPQIEGDMHGYQAFAYCFGYIQAVIQMLS